MKKNMIIWLILIVILVGGLTIIGLKIKNENKEYKTLEKKMTMILIMKMIMSQKTVNMNINDNSSNNPEQKILLIIK